MIKVFEAFAGIGSQNKALSNVGIDYKIVGTSEIDGDAILSYAAIHTDFLLKRKEYEKINIDEFKETMIRDLERLNIPLDYKTFVNKARNLNNQKLYDIHLASKMIKNYGDIREINPQNLPDFDLFTYSFPCQDISIAGFQKGFEANSGTRSSLLWECVKVIETKKPKYLMLENVKNLVGKKHKGNFLLFLEHLESLGYTNTWKVVDAKKQGVPQSRERVFCISILGNDKFNFPEEIPLKFSLNDILEEDVATRFYLNNNQVLDNPIRQDYAYCLDANYWKGVTLQSFLDKHRRQLVTDITDENGKYIPRRLTPKETWRLMGFSDEDFNKADSVVSNTALYKQSGNSIVVPVLEQIFERLFINT